MTLWTAACHTPMSMGFPSQEYWSGLPLPTPGDLPDPGMCFLCLLHWPCNGLFITVPHGKPVDGSIRYVKKFSCALEICALHIDYMSLKGDVGERRMI